MSTPNVLLNCYRDVYQAIRSHCWLWIAPTILFTSAAAGYALLREPTWKAAQALVVREEAISGFSPQGRFGNEQTMKALQETVLEVARSRVVVLESLKSLGPPAHRNSRAVWPSEDEISQLQQRIAVSAPKGAEFGSTEVIYLSIVGSTRQEALDRTAAVCDQLDTRLSDLRNAKAESVISELEKTLQLALNDLEQSTAKLEAMEREVGSDLGELRMLNDSGSGDSNLRTALNQVKAELRQLQSTYEVQQQLRELLLTAQHDPACLVSTPSRLLESQPALKRLKDGLVDVQLRSAELRGRMSTDHPSVVAAIRAEEEVRQGLLRELSSALQSLSADVQVSQQQLRSLEQQYDDLQKRLNRLASLRARYANLVDDMRQRTEIVRQAKENLADGRARQNAARSTSLLTRFQLPIAGERPQGPGRTTITAAGLMAGLMTGAGLIFLALPGGPTHRRRWTDLLHFGRRASDQEQTRNPPSPPLTVGRRTTDPPPSRRATDQPPSNQAERRGGRGRRTDDAGGA